MTSTDQAGRTTTTALDAFGRTVSQEEATGLYPSQVKSYDDGAAHTMVAALLPEGAAQPNMSTNTSYDDAPTGRPSPRPRMRPARAGDRRPGKRQGVRRAGAADGRHRK